MLPYIYPPKPNRIYPESALMKSLDNDIGWVAEIKKNGWRCLAYKEGGVLTLWTRHHTTIKEPMPELRRLLNKMLPDGSIIDGELLQNRTKHIKGVYYVFDVLYLTGDLTALQLGERRKILCDLIPEDRGGVQVAHQYLIGKKALYEKAIAEADENEGIVLKQQSSAYLGSPSRCLQHPQWLKVKRPERHLYV